MQKPLSLDKDFLRSNLFEAGNEQQRFLFPVPFKDLQFSATFRTEIISSRILGTTKTTVNEFDRLF